MGKADAEAIGSSGAIRHTHDRKQRVIEPHMMNRHLTTIPPRRLPHFPLQRSSLPFDHKAQFHRRPSQLHAQHSTAQHSQTQKEKKITIHLPAILPILSCLTALGFSRPFLVNGTFASLSYLVYPSFSVAGIESQRNR